MYSGKHGDRDEFRSYSVGAVGPSRDAPKLRDLGHPDGAQLPRRRRFVDRV
jgi:hypothetical protein